MSVIGTCVYTYKIYRERERERNEGERRERREREEREEREREGERDRFQECVPCARLVPLYSVKKVKGKTNNQQMYVYTYVCPILAGKLNSPRTN